MMSRIGVAVMAVALLLYVVFVGWLAVAFLASGVPIGVAMGAGLAVFGAVGAWVLARELLFGAQAERLARRLEAEGGIPDDEVALLPSGRVVKAEAVPLVERYSAEAAADGGWRSQFRLGIVQDAAGNRKDARASIREAIRREKAGS